MLPGTSQTTAQEQISAAARELNFGSEHRADFSGRSRERNRTATAFLTAIALSFIFMDLTRARSAGAVRLFKKNSILQIDHANQWRESGMNTGSRLCFRR